jgi:hypothetical protein
MSAIVTDDLKHTISEFLLEDSAATYYVGIGKVDQYDSSDIVATPLRTNFEEAEARANLISIKKVPAGNISLVIPRYNWVSGTTYSAFSDTSVGIPTNAYYVLTEDNEVYICIQQGKTATGASNVSIVKPSYSAAAVADTAIFETADGYRWKFAYSLSASRANTFLTSGFIPIEYVKNIGSPNTFQAQQKTVEANADSGAIVGVRIIDGGAGYAGSTLSIKFRGDGQEASATATISGGSIVKVEMDDSTADDGIINGGGKNYTYASASFTGDATLKPILSSKNGLGSDLVRDLKCTSVMFNAKLSGSENGTINTDNDFRQITLLRNLTENNSGANINGTGYKVGRSILMDATVAGIGADATITDDTSGVTATVVEVDSDGSALPSAGKTIFRFIQNQNNIIGPFTAGGNINGGAGTIDGSSGDSDGLVDINSGKMLYIENRSKVQRSTSQSEDIKIILTV